jgi:prephenate dehydrogenase
MSAASASVGLRVRIVGTGLIGASLGIALSRLGFRVSLDDPSPTAAAIAHDLGGGVLAADTVKAPDVVVVAAPPDVVADVVAAELSQWPDAVVTDTASVKGAVLTALQDTGADLSRYVGSHPMAGRGICSRVAPGSWHRDHKRQPAQSTWCARSRRPRGQSCSS